MCVRVVVSPLATPRPLHPKVGIIRAAVNFPHDLRSLGSPCQLREKQHHTSTLKS
jgi:hypothetical protein